jgi:hypothetical protein
LFRNTGGEVTGYRSPFVALATFASLAAVPQVVLAQSVIAGVVKDASGGVLPGVVVEASSDALIERSRTATSDGAGQYRIVDLRPGRYVVTFTLPGFQTVRRDGIDLMAEFTATINADRVGSIEETTAQARQVVVLHLLSPVR